MLHGMDKGFDGIGNNRGTGAIEMDTIGQQAVAMAPGNGVQALPEDEAPNLDGQVAGRGHPVEGQLAGLVMRPQKFIHAFVDRQVGNARLTGHVFDDPAEHPGLPVGVGRRFFSQRRK